MRYEMHITPPTGILILLVNKGFIYKENAKTKPQSLIIYPAMQLLVINL